MPELRRYHLFISHAWSYSEDYKRLEAMLTDAPNFAFDNYSVPRHDPLTDPQYSSGEAKTPAIIGWADQARQYRPGDFRNVCSL